MTFVHCKNFWNFNSAIQFLKNRNLYKLNPESKFKKLLSPPVTETRRKIGNFVFYRNLCSGLLACVSGNFTCSQCLQYMNEKSIHELSNWDSVDVHLSN